MMQHKTRGRKDLETLQQPSTVQQQRLAKSVERARAIRHPRSCPHAQSGRLLECLPACMHTFLLCGFIQSTTELYYGINRAEAVRHDVSQQTWCTCAIPVLNCYKRTMVLQQATRGTARLHVSAVMKGVPAGVWPVR